MVPVSECNGVHLIGRYISNNRTKGTDRVSRKDISKIPEQVLKIAHEGKDVVAEGDKICSKKLFDAVFRSGLDCKLFWVTCSLNTTWRRNKRNGSTCSDSYIKTVATKAENLFWDYEQVFDGEIVLTDELNDSLDDNESEIVRLSKDNADGITCHKDFGRWTRKLAEHIGTEKDKCFGDVEEYGIAYSLLIKHPSSVLLVLEKQKIEIAASGDKIAPKILNERWKKRG